MEKVDHAEQNPSRFLGNQRGNVPSDSDDDRETRQDKDGSKELTLQLLRCKDIESLGSALRHGLESFMPQIYGGCLFTVDGDTEDVFSVNEEGLCSCTPPPDCVLSVYRSGQAVYSPVDQVPDCVLCRIKHQKSTSNKTQVGCLPVTDSEGGPVHAVLVVLGEDFGSQTTAALSFLLQQIAACYSHIQRTFSSQRNSEERASQQLIKLCGDLYDQDAAQLQVKVIKYLEDQTQAECAFLLLVVPETQELFCQVIGKKILTDEIRFPGCQYTQGQQSSFAVALDTKQPIVLDDILVESRKEVEEMVECPVRSLLCVPVTSRNDSNLIALACVVNKRNANRFSDKDISCIRQCFRYTSTVLTSTLAFQNERKLKVQTQAMLQVARHLFTNLDDLTKLLREIMQQARNLTQAERCSVFLIDDETDELVAKVFDGITTNTDNEVQDEIRMPCTQGIAGHVATSGELLNIKDAYSHPLFYRGIDDSTGFRTRNILCFPIKDEKGKILGVAQLCNKKNGPCFTVFDEDVASAFGIYCCISISHSLMYKKVIDSQVRNSLANELMMYHMTSLMYKKLQDSQHRKSLANELMIYHMQVCTEDVEGLTHVDIPHPRLLNRDFVEFSYAPRSLDEDRTLLAILSMFDDLNFISRWRIRRDTLARFVLMVKKGYRNPPYHNWMHAYTVAQFCYQLIRNLKLEKHLEGIELYALFVSCLCHDIDHRGTNNSFQTASKSVLAALYSSEGSVLERHHFAQTMCILNTEGCNVFENLNSKDYQSVLDHMRDIILATDLAHHLKILKNLKEIGERGFDKTSVKDRKLLLCLLMTSCDLSDQTKPWDNTKKVAALIYKEFFSQGDMEKARGVEPIEMMDRERAQIPALQIGFLEHIALPVYKVLGRMFSEVNTVSEAVETNKQHWEKISNLIKLKRGGSCVRMTFDEVLAIENEKDPEEKPEGETVITNGDL